MTVRHGGREAPVPIDSDLCGPTLHLSQAAVLETERLLRTYGGGDEHEGIVFLGGLETAHGAVGMTALSPRAVTTYGSFSTDTEANTDVVIELARAGLTLVGQVHSHPGRWVDHSDGDDEGALVRFEGYWSLVVPEFAREGMRPLGRCGVHVFRGGEFRRLTPEAVGARLQLVPAAIDLRGEAR
ncbi:MAG: hypothetical protein RLO52_22060 [Sandaracinaceae bacterium]